MIHICWVEMTHLASMQMRLTINWTLQESPDANDGHIFQAIVFFSHEL